MKKILILFTLLMSFFSYGQNPSKFPNGISLPNATEQNVLTRVPVMDVDGTITGYVLKTAFELSLGNPAVNGQILSSTTAGVRSWIDPPVSGSSLTFNAPLSESGGVVSFDGSAYVLTANLVSEVNSGFPNLDTDNTDDVLISTLSPENNITIASGTNSQLDALAAPATGETRIEIATDGNVGSSFSGSWNDLTDIPAGFADNIDNTTSGGSGDGVIGNVALSGTDLNFSGSDGGFNGTIGLLPIIAWGNLSGIPGDIADGDDDTQLNESQVDAFVANNGFITSPNDADSDPANEIELPAGGTNGQILSTNGSGVYSWVDDQNSISDGDYGDVDISGSGTVITVKDDVITGANIVNSTINGSADLQDESVTANKLAANSVNQSEIATNGVSIDEIDNSSNGVSPTIGQVPAYNGTDFTWSDVPDFVPRTAFTPTLIDAGGGATYTISSNSSFYTVAGDIVFIRIVLSGINTSGTPSGNLEIENLPLISNSSSGILNVITTNSDQNFYSVQALVGGSQMVFQSQSGLDNNNSVTWSSVDFTFGSLIVTGTYLKL